MDSRPPGQKEKLEEELKELTLKDKVAGAGMEELLSQLIEATKPGWRADPGNVSGRNGLDRQAHSKRTSVNRGQCKGLLGAALMAQDQDRDRGSPQDWRRPQKLRTSAAAQKEVQALPRRGV